MAQVIYNPTDRLPEKFQERFRGHFKGVGFCIKPGEKIKVEDSLAAHMLNEFAQRGLVSLNYGDEDKIEGIVQEALRANRDFKIKQVNVINQRNEERRAIGLPYLVPKGDMRLFAEELGEDLIEPYRVKDHEKQRVTDVEKENIALKEQLKAMNEKLDIVLGRQTSLTPVEPKEPDEANKREHPYEDLPSHEETPIGRLKNKGGRPRNKR